MKGIPGDGSFHHLCFTWSSDNGDYKFWMDGEVVGDGSGFQKGTSIRHGGSAVVGQVQNSLEGDFEASKSWFGTVSGLNVFDEVRSDTDIINEAQTCTVGQGDVISWPQLYIEESLHGEVCVLP